MKKGKFIIIYGINNLGKSTQAKKLVSRLQEIGERAEYIKYPIYNQEPAGSLINSYTRESNPHNFSSTSFQLLHYIDRLTYQETLKKKLESGINIIAEDYFGTGVAWGIGAGVDEKILKYLYSFLHKADLTFLFNGQRFLEARENNHIHESNDDLTEKVRKIHLRLGEEYGWKKVNANLSIEAIHNILWEEVKKII